MNQISSDPEASRRSIQERVRVLGDAVERATPRATLVVIAGAALWPIVAPLVGAGVAASMATGALGLLGGPGQEFVSGFLKRLASGRPPTDPDEARASFERELGERLEASGAEAAALRQDVSRLLESIGGVEVALAAATGETKEALARALAEQSEAWTEFRWMLRDLEADLQAIQQRQAETLTLQRVALDLQRQQLAKTTLLIGLHKPREPESVDDASIEVLAPAEAVCPYKGLLAFEPEDAEYFFGREALLADVLARIAEVGFVAIVGASGSGKTSFVRAGLVDAIWKGALPGVPDARVIMLAPGKHPLEELAMRLALEQRVAPGSVLNDLRAGPRGLELAARQALIGAPQEARLVLVVDQFEEMFTLCHDEAERTALFGALVEAHHSPTSPVVVVLALRGDFYGRLAAFRPLADVVQDHQVLVGPMTREDLRHAIEAPAARAKLIVRQELVDVVVEDLGDDPSLPLLQHALLETWKRRRGRALTVDGYAESGRVHGAIAKTAEQVVTGLEPARQALARSVFLDLIEVGETFEPTRRRSRRSDLVARGDGVESVIDELARERLLTVDESTVELAHEALIRHWPRLRAWLEEDRERLQTRRKLAAAAQEWETLDREAEAVYRGARLAAAEEWAEADEGELGESERAFLAASRRAEDAAEEAARRRFRLTVLAFGLGALLLVAGGVIYLVLRQSSRLSDQQKLTLSLSLASQSQSSLSGDVDLAAILAAEGLRAKETFEARTAALAVLPRAERLAGSLLADSDDLFDATFMPDGDTVAAADTAGRVRRWDAHSLRENARAIDGHTGERGGSFDVSPDGKLLATAGEDRRVQIWDARTSREAAPAFEGHDGPVSDVAFAPDSRTMASAAVDGVRIWDVGDPGRRTRPLEGPTEGGTHLAFSPDGSMVASGFVDATVWLWDVRTRRGQRLPFTRPLGPVTSVAFSHDGTLLAAGGNGIAVWNTRSRRPAERPINASGGGMRLAFDPHGNRLASAGDGNVVRLWDVRTGRLLEPPLAGHRSSISSLAFDREGTRLVSTDTTGGIRLWDMRPERRLIRSREGLPGARLPAGDSLLAISPSGDLVAAVDAAGAFRVSDARTRRAQPIGLRGGEVVVAAAFSRDGARLAIADGENFTVRIVDPRSGRAVGRALPVDAVALALDRRGDRLAIGSFDGSVQLWNPRLGVRMASAFVAAPDGIASLAFTPDARTLAVGDDGTRHVRMRALPAPAALCRSGEVGQATGLVGLNELLVAADYLRADDDLGERHHAGHPYQLGAAQCVLGEVDLVVGDVALIEERLRHAAEAARLRRVDRDPVHYFRKNIAWAPA